MPIRPTSNMGIRTTPKPHQEGESAATAAAKPDAKGTIRNVGDAFEKKSGDPMVEGAVKRFAERSQRILGNDAMGLARRSAGLDEAPSAPTEAQLGQLKSAATDMLKEMPVRAFAPEVAADIEARLRSQGVSIEGLKDKKLGDLGKVGSDVAKQMVDDLKTNNPRTFYGLAAGVAIGGAAYAYEKGSDALVKLGVKPEISTKIGDNTKVDLKAKWDERFSNFEATGGAAHTFKGEDQSTSVKARATVKSGEDGLDITALRLGMTHNRKVGDASTLRVGNQADLKGDRLILNSSVGSTTKLDNGWKITSDTRLTSEFSGDNFEAKKFKLQ